LSQEQAKKRTISQLLTSFLPFESTKNHAPIPPHHREEEDGPSHYPLDLDDPLPYLQLFTPLKCETEIKLIVPPESLKDTKNPLQEHCITIKAPKDMLSITLKMILDPVSHVVTSLDIMEVSFWAEHELGTWIRKQAGARDIGSIAWAINSYWDLAQKRAKCWMHCQDVYSRLIGDGSLGSSSNAKSEKRMSRTETSENEESNAEEITGIVQSSSNKHGAIARTKKRALQRHLGIDSILFQNYEVAFRVEWRIDFDWTGNSESYIIANVGVPAVCRFTSNFD
jgi:hypothetical protein